ncbi:hypothetical protein CDAR_408521 [Caerostris darwini]|uniref:Uncharacterized protein n=1 Tax=Caerostris darwini TaxID=1538125 RepID=A0AAV4X637_9ARAC|nr:hypothetical protein CDAR_408521 [Caerostris darwini]
MDRKDKSKRKPRNKNGPKTEKKKSADDRHRSPHSHQKNVQEVFTIESSNPQERPHSRNRVQNIKAFKLKET